MSGAEVLAVIGVLGPLLGASANLVHRIRDRRRKKKEDEKAILQKHLEIALGEGELEIRSTYERYVKQLGDQFRVGDSIAQQRVERHILEAQNMKRILQLAWDQKKDIKDIQEHWKSATAIPRETKQTMDELSLRLMGVKEYIPPTPISPTTSFQIPPIPSQSTSALSPSRSETLVESTPEILGSPSNSSQIYMGQSSPHGSSSHSISAKEIKSCEVLNLTSPKPGHLSQGEPIFSPPPARRLFSEPEVQLMKMKSSEQPRTSSQSSHSVSAIDPIRSGSMGVLPSQVSHFQGGSISGSGPRGHLVGAPNKKNKFHGFCEGAWSNQSSIKEGMELVQKPTPYIGGTVPIIQCRKCRFRGEPYGPEKKDKKRWKPDPRVWKSRCGIQYRYSFLAKSHQPSKDQFVAGENTSAKMATQHYGCIFCWAGDIYTDSFGGIESLMNHIVIEHGRNIREDTQKRTNCIIDRVASGQEEFDINIPPSAVPSSDTESEKKSAASIASLSIREIDENLLDLNFDEASTGPGNHMPVLEFTHNNTHHHQPWF